MAGTEQTTYGERYRDLIPFKSGLEDFSEAILEDSQIEDSIKIELEAESQRKPQSNWLRDVRITANYDDLEYVETGIAVSFHDGGVHQLLDDVKDKIKTYLQETDSYDEISFERTLD